MDWTFNAWGGPVRRARTFPGIRTTWWRRKICEIGARGQLPHRRVLCWRAGPSMWTVEGTVLTTEMCLLSQGRNPEHGAAGDIEEHALRLSGVREGPLAAGRYRPR
ncbi:MAG: agmatine deiminase family protein [Oscillospiraceae bacterium]